jgi:hypothetical protein
MTFTDVEYAGRKRNGRRETFLETMDAPVPYPLERQNLQKAIFDTTNAPLEKEGKIMHGGTIVDAATITAPGSTKNGGKSRDPEMKQTKKGNTWH